MKSTTRFIYTIAAVAMVMLGVGSAPAQTHVDICLSGSIFIDNDPWWFPAGPSVRVGSIRPGVEGAEFKWSFRATWRGWVCIYDNPNANPTGFPASGLVLVIDSVDTAGVPVIDTDHVVRLPNSLLPANPGTYYLRAVMEDPTGGSILHGTATPLAPFFSGAQSIGNVFVDAGADRARILWDANVIGTGRVDYGPASPDELSVTDEQNVTAHNIELTGLTPGTTYQYRVCNRHAIDGDCLAARTGSFTTLSSTPPVVQAIDNLRERTASYGLPRGTARSLDAKLEATLAAWQAGDTAGACSALTAFLNEVRAQTGNKLSEAQAQQLTAAANDVRVLIGC